MVDAIKTFGNTTFKTYLGLTPIAKNMALMATSTEKKKKGGGVKGCQLSTHEGRGHRKKGFFCCALLTFV
jgi:hypothetical protein